MDNILISSTEELSPEDRLLLVSSKRQEPQGEEHGAGVGENKDKTNLTSQGQVLTRTKSNKHQVQSSSEDSSEDSDDEDGIVYQNVGMMAANGGNSATNSHSNSNSLSSNRSHGSHGSSAGATNHGGGRGSGGGCNLSLDSNSHSAYNTLIIHHNNGSLLADTWIPASHEFTSLATGSNRNSTCSSSNPRKSQSPSREGQHHGHQAQQGHAQAQQQLAFDYEAVMREAGLKSNELSDIPRDYLNQLTVLKHLAKEVQQDPMSEPPSSKLLRSASFSRSQPDLSQSLGGPGGGGGVVGVSGPSNSASHSYYYNYAPAHPVIQYPDYPAQLQQQIMQQQAQQQHQRQQQQQQQQSRGRDVAKRPSEIDMSRGQNGSGQDDPSVPSTSVQMLEILMRENSNLRTELANARMRIQTIHKLESELTRLQKQHASLFESAERRESLERTARVKLSSEVKRLTAVNRELLSSSNSLQNLSSYSLGSDVDPYRKELSKKDASLAQLISQNKDLTATKDRQEIELAAQRATLEEQRTHIDILDSALTTAQGNVVRLEEECRRNQDYAEKVSQLQRALSSLQVYNEKREQSEKKLRSQLESEITELKLQLASKNAKSNLTNTRANPMPNSNSATPCQSPSTNSRNYTAPPPYPGPTSSASSSNQNLHQTSTSASSSNQNLNLNQSHLSSTSSSDNLTPELQCLQEKLRLSEDKIASLTSVVQRWEHFFSLDTSPSGNDPQGSQQTPVGTTPNTPNSWGGSSSRGGTPHFTFNNGPGTGGTSSGCSSNGALDDLPSTQNRAADIEWKIKDLESRLLERDNMLRALSTMGAVQQAQAQQQMQLQVQPGYGYSTPVYSSSPYVPTGFRESPSYTAASLLHQHQISQQQQQSQQGINHQVSASLASMMDRRYGGVDPLLFYEKVGKCESEPPSYANLPPKLRLGGSGSSLAKNSNESLGSAGHGGGMSNNVSEPESVSSSDGGINGGGVKSIDEQLKELNTQLLSKGAAAAVAATGYGPSLKMQSSGLCCIPGFTNTSSTTRKGKISQPLLESVTTDANGNLSSNKSKSTNPPKSSSSSTKKSVITATPTLLPPLPRPPTPVTGSGGGNRTSSGPPFMAACEEMSGHQYQYPLSSSVESIMASGPGQRSQLPQKGPSQGPNVFSPVAVKGLPPKSPATILAQESSSMSNKCRSLERDQKSKSSNNELHHGGISSVLKFDPSATTAARCKSLDRRELKAAAKEEKKSQKSSSGGGVGGKAAFFGGLLRRSPSPSRKNKDASEKEKSPAPPSTSKGSRFTFGRTGNHGSHNITTPSASTTATPSPGSISTTTTSTGLGAGQSDAASSSDAEIDTEFLDHQGRSSQSQRASRVSKWSPASAGAGNLPSLKEHGSPWVQRRSGGDIGSVSASSSRKPSVESIDHGSSGGGGSGDANDPTKKWGKIVKSPFGLRYTFGGHK